MRIFARPDRGNAQSARRTFCHALTATAVSFDALAASLADDMHGGEALAVDLVEAKPHQLRHPHSGREGQM
jgi:hypothetical protein